mmetsp:Transcript_119552/g.338363  ORF Transcript_119552/g.338363 Transcript_119552/m.338363 type:complete len:261 (-) Transcript_119552:262-1044(-)
MADSERGDQVTSGGESASHDGPTSSRPNALDGRAEVVQRIVQTVRREQSVTKHDGVDTMLSQQRCDRLSLRRAKELVVSPGADDDGPPGLRELLGPTDQARSVTAVKQGVIAQGGQPRKRRTAGADAPEVARATPQHRLALRYGPQAALVARRESRRHRGLQRVAIEAQRHSAPFRVQRDPRRQLSPPALLHERRRLVARRGLVEVCYRGSQRRGGRSLEQGLCICADKFPPRRFDLTHPRRSRRLRPRFWRCSRLRAQL